MRVRIFTCHHAVPTDAVRNELFATLVSGVHGATDGAYLGDLDGKNIAAHNIYTELRHQWFVWKNMLGPYDYVGFEHYRRQWFVDCLPAEAVANILPELLHFRSRFQSEQTRPYLDVGHAAYEAHFAMRRAFGPDEFARFNRWLGGCDIVTQRPSTYESLRAQWDSCQTPAHWPIILESVRNNPYFVDRRPMIDWNTQSASWNNMYIMRAEIFDEYMTFLMDCIGYLEAHMSHWHRAWGHCAERIFNMWLFQRVMERPGLRVGCLPFLQRTQAYVAPLPN